MAKTFVTVRKAGDKILLQIEDKTILDLLIVAIEGKQVRLSFQIPEGIKIVTIKKLLEGAGKDHPNGYNK